MKAFHMTNDLDLDFDGRELVFTEGLHQLAQEAENSIGTRKGEWFLDEEEGMSYDALYHKPFNKNEFRTDMIESFSGMTQPINMLEAKFGQPNAFRSIGVEVKLRTVDGEILQLDDLEVGE